MNANDSLSVTKYGEISAWSRLTGTCLNFLVIWILCAELVPGINESHYLPKAKAAWDPSFAPDDLFLSSGNAHWFFSLFCGWLTTFAPLTAVAWTGRLVCWWAMAFAWQQFAYRMRFSILLGSGALAAWILATRLGNWAGEWALGGFEAKSLAYPCIVLAIAELTAAKWARVWPLVGLAIAFHPLVGGWAGLTIVWVWLWSGRRSPLGNQIVPGCLGLALAALGIFPALSMIGGPSQSGSVVVAQIHAFYRLAHHQSPRLFHASQHLSGGLSLALLILATWLHRRIPPLNCPGPIAPPVSTVLKLGWLSVAVSLAGLLIDTVGVRIRPDAAAGLLRFYWFRWSDVMVPLAWVCCVLHSVLQFCGEHEPGTLPGATTDVAKTNVQGYRCIPLGLCWLAILCVSADQVAKIWSRDYAPADQTLLMSENKRLRSSHDVVKDWQEACAWIRKNTPPQALFFTPRAQQTFKWYAQRAEVVTFKDVPQDGKSLLEWYDRVGRCAPPRDSSLQPMQWSTDHMNRLQRRYGFAYVLVDRRIQRDPLLLEIVFQNKGFAVFKYQSNSTH